MTLPTVSIGVPTYNRAAFLARAVTSVLQQDYEGDIQCIVIDDASTDDSLEVLSRIQAAPGRTLEVYSNEVNRGIAYSKNRCLTLGTGPLRGVLDSDDFYAPDFVATCVAELAEHPDVGLVYTDNFVCDAGGNRLRTEPAADWSIDALLGCQLRGDCYLARWSMLERTQLHDELFELEVDYDLFYQAHALGPLRRIPTPLMTVTQHDGRTSTARGKAAFWHAAGLGKYGHPISWAERRASAHPEWMEHIAAGYAYGQSLAYRNALKRLLRVDDNTQARWCQTWREEDGSRLDVTLLGDVMAWLPERCRFVDLGCGDGTLARAIVSARPECSGLGIDFALSDALVDSERLQWAPWDLRDTSPMPLPWAADVVLCTEVIEHLQDPARVFTVAKQMLAPRGHLLLSTPLSDDIKDTRHLWALRPTDVAAMAEATGGRVLHMVKTGEYGRRAVLYVVGWW